MAGLSTTPDCEVDQILQAGFVRPEQLHGVEINRDIHDANVAAGPDLAWHHGDFLQVMHQYDGFNPSLVNADLLQTVDTAADYIARILHLLESFNATLIANFIMEHRGYRCDPDHVLSRLAQCQQFRHAMNNGWAIKTGVICIREPATGLGQSWARSFSGVLELHSNYPEPKHREGMQLVKPDNPIFRKVCRANFTVTMRDIMQMFAMLQDTKGVGLAAPQVGIDARLFVTVWGEVFVNPRVVEIDGPVRSTEGCLSLPGITAQVDRWDTRTLGIMRPC